MPCSMVQYVQDSRWFETKLSKQIFIPVRDVYIYIFIIYMICITCIYIYIIFPFNYAFIQFEKASKTQVVDFYFGF